MKKYLYISSSDPLYFNGGAIGTKKYLKILEELKKEKKIEYITFVSKQVTRKKVFDYEIKRNKIKAIYARILGYSDQLELAWRKIIKIIKEKKIDCVIIQSSRLGKISQKIREKFPTIEIIQNFDNCEYKFSKMFTSNMNILIKKIELKNIYINEKKCYINSNKNVFLTSKDLKLITKLYGKVDKKNSIFPIIYEKNNIDYLNLEREEKAIFTGSLDMEANIEAALFIINNLKEIIDKTKIKKLILAGKNPSKRLKEAVIKNNLEAQVSIVENPSPEKMSKLLLSSKLYLSPIFKGSGIKTKVLEALSHGLPIIASEHTMIGYERIKEKECIFIFSKRSKESFIEGIEQIISSDINFEEIRNFYKKEFLEFNNLEKEKKIIYEE